MTVTREERARTLNQLVRENTEVALAALVEVPQNTSAPAAARVQAPKVWLDRGWGDLLDMDSSLDSFEKREETDHDLALSEEFCWSVGRCCSCQTYPMQEVYQGAIHSRAPFFPGSVFAVKLLAGAIKSQSLKSFASSKGHQLLFSHPQPLLPLQ